MARTWNYPFRFHKNILFHGILRLVLKKVHPTFCAWKLQPLSMWMIPLHDSFHDFSLVWTDLLIIIGVYTTVATLWEIFIINWESGSEPTGKGSPTSFPRHVCDLPKCHLDARLSAGCFWWYLATVVVLLGLFFCFRDPGIKDPWLYVVITLYYIMYISQMHKPYRTGLEYACDSLAIPMQPPVFSVPESLFSSTNWMVPQAYFTNRSNSYIVIRFILIHHSRHFFSLSNRFLVPLVWTYVNIFPKICRFIWPMRPKQATNSSRARFVFFSWRCRLFFSPYFQGVLSNDAPILLIHM